ncbi:MAG: peptidylprolyl isomerase [Candidatus Beckwithbacteria bacterium]|nr:peptidylprolyl isomerase [Patescibacteria group bacterium]
MKLKQVFLLLIIGLFLTGCGQKITQEEQVKLPVSKTEAEKEVMKIQEKAKEKVEVKVTEFAVVKLAEGEVKIKLYKQEAPNTVLNFLGKATTGYYEGLNFHRVEDWVVQGGDPLGNGTGGGKMPTELNKVEFKRGSVGVARGGDIKVSNDSQFFICTTDCGFLTGQYTNFGEVVSGMELVDKVKIGDKILKITPTE